MSKIIAISKERYNGGVRIKRAYGSSTITTFWVFREEDKDSPAKWKEIKAYGPTPGDRKTFAINVFLTSQAISG